MSAADFLLYGSYGYTGSLIVAEALRRGLRPLLAGRARGKLARLHTPHSYTLTALTALAGKAPPGFQTPAKAYGADFLLGSSGVRREDLPSVGSGEGG